MVDKEDALQTGTCHNPTAGKHMLIREASEPGVGRDGGIEYGCSLWSKVRKSYFIETIKLIHTNLFSIMYFPMSKQGESLCIRRFL